MQRIRDELEQMVGQKLTELKPIGGVYFVLRDGELIYIGQSANVHRRAIDRRPTDTVLFIEFQDPVEGKLIWKLRPKGNYVNERVRSALEGMQ